MPLCLIYLIKEVITLGAKPLSGLQTHTRTHPTSRYQLVLFLKFLLIDATIFRPGDTFIKMEKRYKMGGERGNTDKTCAEIVKIYDSLQTNSQVIAFYDDVASSYSEIVMTEMQHPGPQIVAEEAGLLVPKGERPLCRVLDIAAGTGWVGRELRKIGFRNLDALEASEGMLKELTDTGLYNNMYKEVIGVTTTDSKVPEGVYDLVVVVSALIDHHIEVSGVDHMIRFAKPGGLLLMTAVYDFVEFRKKLDAHLDQLEERGIVKKISERVFPNYHFTHRGVLYSLRVM